MPVAELRVYEPEECGPDGYPHAWHASIKHAVREQARNRCVRCGHPYVCGASNPEWSACDHGCDHGGEVRGAGGSLEPVTVPNVGVLLAAGDAVEARWRVLTVHHLTGDKRDCRWWNLAALCQRCHLRIQGRVQMARVWPHEHSEWFRPYVAGWYAWSYLGEEISRAEAVDRMDELLALEAA